MNSETPPEIKKLNSPEDERILKWCEDTVETRDGKAIVTGLRLLLRRLDQIEEQVGALDRGL